MAGTPIDVRCGKTVNKERCNNYRQKHQKIEREACLQKCLLMLFHDNRSVFFKWSKWHINSPVERHLFVVAERIGESGEAVTVPSGAVMECFPRNCSISSADQNDSSLFRLPLRFYYIWEMWVLIRLFYETPVRLCRFVSFGGASLILLFKFPIFTASSSFIHARGKWFWQERDTLMLSDRFDLFAPYFPFLPAVETSCYMSILRRSLSAFEILSCIFQHWNGQIFFKNQDII